ISRLPQGMVILPALDRAMGDEEWELLDEAHPQWGMAQLLSGMDSTRAEVQEFDLPDEEGDSPRVALLKTALRPAEATNLWREEALDWQSGLSGCHRLDCATIQHEATTIALLLRDALETPGKTAALVTPNRELARRVAAILRRFHVEIDDSAGTPLSRTPGGVFLQLVVDMVAAQAAPIPLLALLKHPFALLGLPAGEAHRLARRLERYTLRGVRFANALHEIAKEIVKNDKIKQKEDLTQFVERLARAIKPMEEAFASGDSPLAVLLKNHIAVAEVLSTDQNGVCRLWEGEDGEALLAFIHEIAASAERLEGKLPTRSYPAVLGTMLKGRAWRPKFGTHPRLHILSPMESRLQRFDRVVLAGLNEGSWPMDTGQDPWLSRPMRKDFKLPQPEERIGLSAHDFYVLASAGEVFLTRAEKEGGAASVPSRWLLRLEAVLGAQGGAEAKARWTEAGKEWLGWAAELDAAEPVEPWGEPMPRPPVSARPRSLFVTRMETLLRNPYGLYASHILGLRKLDPIDKEPGNAEFGNLVHAALEDYLKQAERGVEAILACGRAQLEPLMSRPAVAALWWPRFERIAQWVAQKEAEIGWEISSSTAEDEISMEWQAPAGMFKLQSRADRIDELKSGRIRLIDYKTGEPFKNNAELERGLVCQLLLGGAIIMAQGKPLEDLQYWALKGGNSESRVESLAAFAANPKRKVGKPLEEWIQGVLEDVKAVVAGYDDPETPYPHCPVAEDAPAYNDYEHLARPQEWGGDT
ncbi:MAG: double-strand break repair protein AddB, partial [Alphaproteobacteria bacterium]|nr:double-strand break repair protein AddB [Alphaproteobacteria bacterium]